MTLTDVLALCGFMTLVAVSTCCYMTVLGGIVYYKKIKEIDVQIAEIPKVVAQRINAVIAEYVEPVSATAQSPDSTQPIVNNKDEFEKWEVGALH